MRIPRGLLFMWSVVPSFRFFISVGASQKTRFWHSENGKKHFSWDKMNIGLCGVPRHPKGHVRIRYGLILINYAMIRDEPSSFDLKAMQP
jgi:hypothetical protein